MNSAGRESHVNVAGSVKKNSLFATSSEGIKGTGASK